MSSDNGPGYNDFSNLHLTTTTACDNSNDHDHSYTDSYTCQSHNKDDHRNGITHHSREYTEGHHGAGRRHVLHRHNTTNRGIVQNIYRQPELSLALGTWPPSAQTA